MLGALQLLHTFAVNVLYHSSVEMQKLNFKNISKNERFNYPLVNSYEELSPYTALDTIKNVSLKLNSIDLLLLLNACIFGPFHHNTYACE